MKFSAQEEFGLRCMVAIANEGDNGFLTIPLIAKAEGMTQSHVAKLLAILRRAGFVKSTRGQLGGYALGKPASKIEIKGLLAELGGRLYDDEYCNKYSGVQDVCVHTGKCQLSPLWKDIQAAVDSAINGMSLQDLVDVDPSCNIELHKTGRPKAASK